MLKIRRCLNLGLKSKMSTFLSRLFKKGGAKSGVMQRIMSIFWNGVNQDLGRAILGQTNFFNHPLKCKIAVQNIMLIHVVLLFIGSKGISQSANPINQSPAEDDWSLPAYVKKSGNAGLFWEYTFKDADNLILTWKQLNPAEGIYNWAILDTAVTLNIPFFLRIWASDTSHVPKWVKTKYPDMPVLHWGRPGETYPDLLGKTSPGNFYAIWNKGFAQEFKVFLKAFKSRNYLSSPNLKFMYVPAAWRWNEWELGPMLQELLNKAPITPANFELWFKEHLNDYADASNGYQYKMVFTGYGRIENPIYYAGKEPWFFNLNDTLNGSNELTDYAVSIGMSVREGAQEYFNSSNDHYSWGAPSKTINNINYQYINEKHPLHLDPRRIIGTENEGFCNPAMLGACSYYHVKMSTLKALQLRVNWLNTNDRLIAFDPSLFQYARLTMNKNVFNSPDAWVSLRQTYDPFFSANPPNPVYNSARWVHRVTLPYRNWEKWLYQRDVAPNGMVKPVYPLNSNFWFDRFNYEAFEAMQTNKATGNNYIYFEVDSAFIFGGRNQVELKISYLDNFNGNWWVEYDSNGPGVYKQSQKISNNNTNQWKTVSIALPDAGFSNRQNGNMDFRIFNGGVNDLSVRFVRLIKMNNPVTSTNEVPSAQEKVKVFPNPANSVLNFVSDVPIKMVTVFDKNGRLLFHTNKNQVSISDLSPGLHIAEVITADNQILRVKFLKSN